MREKSPNQRVTMFLIQCDGTYMDGWSYVRDIHGGVSNLSMESTAALLGTVVEKWSLPILVNKGRKNITPDLAVYNKDGNYRLIMKDPPHDCKGWEGCSDPSCVNCCPSPDRQSNDEQPELDLRTAAIAREQAGALRAKACLCDTETYPEFWVPMILTMVSLSLIIW